MDLFSLFRSSAAEILFSKRLIVGMYLILGLAILGQAGAATYQFFVAYLGNHRFDTDPAGFIVITLMLFLPFWLVGALILRACLQRARLALWVRKAFTIANYKTSLLPAEAGFLVDYAYTHRELIASLLDLHFKAVIALEIGEDKSVTITRLQVDILSLSPYEQFLVGALTSGSGFHTYYSLDDLRLIEIGETAQGILMEELVNKQMLRPERRPNHKLRVIFKFLYLIAGLVGVVSIVALVTDPQSVLETEPLYRMAVSELLVLTAALLLMVGVVSSGLRPRFTRDFKDPAYEGWTEAAGFMLYLRTVYKDRFAPQQISNQTLEEIRTFVPYAVAFGMVGSDTESVMIILHA
jgi:hypothetical protein